MGRCLAFVITWPALAGCSLIYNPNNLPNPPGEAGVSLDVELGAERLGEILRERVDARGVEVDRDARDHGHLHAICAGDPGQRTERHSKRQA